MVEVVETASLTAFSMIVSRIGCLQAVDNQCEFVGHQREQTGVSLAMNLSGQMRCLQAEASTFASSYTYIAFLRRVLEQTTQPIILIQDGAKYHTSAETKAFFAQQTARLQVVQLPTYSPDYNPIEKLWKKIKQQETHLHYFPTFEALTEKVEQALLKFTNAPEEILTLCSLPTELAQAA